MRAADITMVFQEPNDLPQARCTRSRAQMGGGARSCGMQPALSEKDARTRTLKLLELVGIRDAASGSTLKSTIRCPAVSATRDDCHGARQRTGPAIRRRADHGRST